MSDSSEFKIPDGLLLLPGGGRRYVSPFDADHEAEYRCPECMEIIALHREGHVGSDPDAPVMRDPHFAHLGDGAGCGGGRGESHRHEAAKWNVAHAILDWVAGIGERPGFLWNCRRCGKRHGRGIVGADEVLVDQEVPAANIGKRRPDVYVRYGDTHTAIEICFTNQISDDKIADYAALSQWAEIDATAVLEGDVRWRLRRSSWARTCDPRGALCPPELAKANALSQGLYTQAGGAVVKEPADNVIGKYKILRRTDGLFVASDTTVWPPNGAVFDEESAARAFARSNP